MTYYKVKKGCGNKTMTRKKAGAVYPEYYGIYIANELYTKKELENMTKRGINVNYDYFEPVNVSKNNIYWFFGARFSSLTGGVI